jgi:FHS family L-fucose permease-like MFS transporter
MAIEMDAGVHAGLPSNRALRRPLALAIGCFTIWGLAYGLLDVLNKHFQETLYIGKAQSSWLQIAYFGAYLVMSIPAGRLLEARGYKAGLISGLLLTALGALLFVPSASGASFPCFVGSMFVLATGLCFLETSADTYVNVLGAPAQAPQRLNLAQSFNALGVFFGPLIGGALFFNPSVASNLGGEHRAVQLTYATVAVLGLLFAFVLRRAHLPEIRDPHESFCRAGRDNGTLRLIHQRHFVLGVLTQGLYVGAQVGIGAFFLNLVTETWTGMTSRQGAFLLSLATVGYLVGRFASTAVLLKVSASSLLTAYGLINVILCLIVSAGVEKVSAIALVAVFFFMSAMFATIFTLGVRDLGPQTKRGASIMVMAIGGGVLLPYPMGLIADAYGTPIAFRLPAAIFAVVALYGWVGSGKVTAALA